MRYGNHLVTAAIAVVFISQSVNSQNPPAGQATPQPAVSQAVKAQPAAPAPTVAQSQPASSEKSDIEISRAVIALNINENEPENIADTFPSEVKRVYCFTHLKGVKAPIEIEHRWYWNDDMLNAVKLDIKSASWRTYSAKKILPGMTGEWRVAIVNLSDDSVLKTIKFIVK